MRPRPRQPVEPALKESSLESYSFPSIDDCFDDGWEKLAEGEIKANQDRFIIAYIGNGLFERSWMMRGYDKALMDIALYREFYEELVENIMLLQMQMLERILQLLTNGIFFTDDWGCRHGVMVGAKQWLEIFNSRFVKMFKKVHEAIKYSLLLTCGSIEEILPDAIKIGLDVYESVQPEAKNNNPYDLIRKYGEQITFLGGLGSQSITPIGTLDEIRNDVKKPRKELGHGGRYILVPARPIQPETPVEVFMQSWNRF